MGLGYPVIEALLREARHRPIDGEVLEIGRQTVYFGRRSIRELFGTHGINLDHVRDSDIELDQATLNRRTGFAEEELISDLALFRLLGASTIKVLDHSAYEQADLICDLNRPVPSTLHASTDFIIDGSTLDNVFDPAAAIRNYAAMLRPGGRVLAHNVFSNHAEPYVIPSPLWYLDYFVSNAFVDCKIYILVSGDYDSQGNPPAPRRNVFTIDFEFLADPAQAVVTFAAPLRMSTLVFAEKGPQSTSDVIPVQQPYRSEQEWSRYRSNLRRIMSSPREHLARSFGEIDHYSDIKKGHLFVGKDFVARDPSVEIGRRTATN